MNRRTFTRGLCSCAAVALAGCVTDGASPPVTSAGHGLAPGYRPASDTDEGGLWAQMDKAEAELKRSRFLVHDPAVKAYVNEIACRLSAQFCPDVRVYVVHTPFFNAMMAPNGMMQVWTGLLLRVQNEAQLAAVIGHEMGHYLQRHSLQQWRDMKGKTDLAAFFSFAGLPGAIAQIGLLASIYSFSRDQEREADAIGLDLMAKAGYRPDEAARVWEYLIAEQKTAEQDRPRDPFFATHPAPEERVDNLRTLAGGRSDRLAGDGLYRDRFRQNIRSVRAMLLADEIKLRRFGQSELLLDHLLAEAGEDAELHFYKGEVYRQRASDGDDVKALQAYTKAIDLGPAPPETFRSLGLVQMRARDLAAAEASFRRYLQLMPDASDREIILSYIQRRS